jgi:hypothetical protein
MVEEEDRVEGRREDDNSEKGQKKRGPKPPLS